LWDNQLDTLPAEIGRLTCLQNLDLTGNQLSDLPAEIGRLTSLQNLDLRGNQLSALPAEIGRLTNPQNLDLRGNQLSALPGDLGYLRETLALGLDANPLQEPLPELIRRSNAELFSYLRSLKRDAEAQYEAKLLLVGQGNVGKTSLLAALQGKKFVAN